MAKNFAIWHERVLKVSRTGKSYPRSTKTTSTISSVLQYIETEDFPIQVISLEEQHEHIPPGRDRLAENGKGSRKWLAGHSPRLSVIEKVAPTLA